MTRPIIWAMGTLVTVAFVASVAGQRLASLGMAAKPPAPSPSRPQPDPPDRRIVALGDRSGHFVLSLRIEGADTSMMVDTGASIMALTAEDAERAGVRPGAGDYTHTVATANGMVAAASVRLREVRLGQIVVRDVEAVVMPPGRLGVSLLGMSFLRRLRGFDISDGRLTLRG